MKNVNFYFKPKTPRVQVHNEMAPLNAIYNDYTTTPSQNIAKKENLI